MASTYRGIPGAVHWQHHRSDGTTEDLFQQPLGSSWTVRVPVNHDGEGRLLEWPTYVEITLGATHRTIDINHPARGGE